MSDEALQQKLRLSPLESGRVGDVEYGSLLTRGKKEGWGRLGACWGEDSTWLKLQRISFIFLQMLAQLHL